MIRSEPQPIATLLVGAEGTAEVEGQPWVRQATIEEQAAFVASRCKGDENLFHQWIVDRICRPYWLLTILETAPEQVQDKARQRVRCVRLFE